MKWKNYFAVYTLFLLTIFVLAYMGHIPTKLNLIPFYDSIGHFVLYGTWGFLFAMAFSRPLAWVGKFAIQKGIFLVVPVAVVEECLQSLSPTRTFSLFDLGWGLLGITFAWLLANRIQGVTVKRKLQNP